MKHLNIIFSILFINLYFVSLNGQQLANSSHIAETRTAWNPAYTAVGNDMIFDGFFRTQWIGFAGAPLSGFASFQYPMLDYNMSGGAILNFDKTGPVSKMGVQLNYAYKLQEVLSRYGQMSLGISANFQQYNFNGTNAIINDFDDNLLLNNRQSAFFPSFGAGFFYTSNVREYKGNTFFIGGAVNQLFTTEVLVNEFDQVRQKHIHFNIGGRFYNYDSYLEPMITANLVQPDIIDVLYSLRYEKEDTFWAGLGFSGAGMAAMQGGIILDRFGNKYAKLKIGVLANYGLTSSLANNGAGTELYVSYNFDMK
jgi:type IX secretion system PorP/SprF family membrane protein